MSTQIQDYRREIRDGVTPDRQAEIDTALITLGYQQIALSQNLAETADGVIGLDATSTLEEAQVLEEQAKQAAETKLLEARAFIKDSFASLANPEGLTSDSVSELFSTLYAQAEQIPELAQNVSDFVLQALEDMKNPDSLLSRNFANLPLPENTESDEYRIILAAKVREYDTDLDYNLEKDPELVKAKADFLLILQAQA